MPKAKTVVPETFDEKGQLLAQQHAQNASAAANELAELKQTDSNQAAMTAGQLGYDGSLDPDVIQQIVRVKCALAEACFFEYAGFLALLRESTLHGDWEKRCESLGISKQHAHQHISMFKRASLTTSPSAFAKIGFTKNRILQTLDDTALEQLAAGQSINGVALPDIEKMSTRQLRGALTEIRLAREADEAVLSEQAAELTQLKRGKARVADNDWQANFAPLRDQIHVATRQLDHQIGVVDLVVDQALASPYDGPDADSADEILQRARGEVADQVRDLIARQRRVLAALERKFAQTLGVFATAQADGHDD